MKTVRLFSLTGTIKDLAHVDNFKITVHSLITLQSTQPMNKEEFMETCRRNNLEAVESHDVNEESGKKMRKSLIWYQRLKMKHNVTSLLFSNQLLI